jgi:hypothetical protein
MEEFDQNVLPRLTQTGIPEYLAPEDLGKKLLSIIEIQTH